MTPAVSRIAPTPSGYLHVGNAANFLLTWLAVRLRGGRLLLRIDDLDRDRRRPEYVDDIFFALEWLGIGIDEGPSGTDDFFAHYSQTLRYDAYREALEQLEQNGAQLFACACSRKTLSGSVLYPGTCRNDGLARTPMETALRIAVPGNTRIDINGEPVALAQTVGDFILWRRDDLPAYQLVSVVEDRAAGVNLIVRGYDLFESTAAQLFLAPYLHADTFSGAAFIHHDLILRRDGSKFSKSDSDYALHEMRGAMGDRRALQSVFDAAQRLLGLTPAVIGRPAELLERCRAAADENRQPGNALLQSILGETATLQEQP